MKKRADEKWMKVFLPTRQCEQSFYAGCSALIERKKELLHFTKYKESRSIWHSESWQIITENDFLYFLYYVNHFSFPSLQLRRKWDSHGIFFSCSFLLILSQKNPKWICFCPPGIMQVLCRCYKLPWKDTLKYLYVLFKVFFFPLLLNKSDPGGFCQSCGIIFFSTLSRHSVSSRAQEPCRRAVP